ncbi:MAG: ABC transporter substrate-binding protein, partial [Robiginitomaculum sp.]|nr:ABC transporter substrate-binding protein [Robiginitomaculum sp.]
MRVLLLIFSALAFMGTNEATPKRVVSTSLCGDSYVLWLVPETNIAALSWQADDHVSNAPQNMRGLSKAWDDIERLLTLKPDLVVFGAGEGRIAKPLLDKAGISYVNMNWGEDFATIDKNRKALAQAAHLQPLKIETVQRLPRGTPKVLYLSSSGATAGPNTYVDEVISAAGGINIITKTGWHTPDPENLVTLKPDLIVTSFFKDSYASAY